MRDAEFDRIAREWAARGNCALVVFYAGASRVVYYTSDKATYKVLVEHGFAGGTPGEFCSTGHIEWDMDVPDGVYMCSIGTTALTGRDGVESDHVALRMVRRATRAEWQSYCHGMSVEWNL